MTITRRRMTLEEFLALPDEKPALELEPDGTVIQKVSPKGKHGRLQFSFVSLVEAFAGPRRLAIALPELRDVFGGAAYVPDVSVYVWDRVPWTSEGEVPDDFSEPPDIAVEIVSPGQSVNALVRRCLWYVDNGVQIAVLVDAYDRSVVTFRPQGTVHALRGADAIDLTSVLPGFELTVDQLFATLRP